LTVHFGMTTRRGVFAGGDVVHRPQTVVSYEGKDVALGIEQYVDAVKLLQYIDGEEKQTNDTEDNVD
jgi:glutamate synthase (NADPH/NADH) small chain